MSTPDRNPLLVDEYGRTVRYLRLSVTDRCNLRCLYCRSNVLERCIPHEDVLRYEEMLRVVGAAVASGVEKVRLTGGEPFARKHLLSFMEMLREHYPQVDIRITSNGTLLRPHVAALRQLGVKVVNISLDSFDPKSFAAITGRDLLHEVRAAMDALLEAGIGIKINAVALRGINDKELKTFLDFAATHPVDVRFIEFMPMGSTTRWNAAHFWSAEDILHAAQDMADLRPLALGPSVADAARGDQGPARMFALQGGLGRFGLITPMSNHFCHSCNRLRVTSDGMLRTCLFDDKEYRLRGMLRHPRTSEAQLRRVLELATRNKPLGEALLRARKATAVARKKMVSIGG